MRKVRRVLMIAGLLLAAVLAVHAEDAASPDEEMTSGVEIRSTGSAGPDDLIVAELTADDSVRRGFGSPGTLLGRATRNIRRVDVDELVKRKLAMYEGKRYFRNPSVEPDMAVRDGDYLAGNSGKNGRLVGPVASVEQSNTWLVWLLVVVITTTLLVAWKMGWFTSFSIRHEQQRAAKAAARGYSGLAPGQRVWNLDQEKPDPESK